jgi:hypothetical protein
MEKLRYHPMTHVTLLFFKVTINITVIKYIKFVTPLQYKKESLPNAKRCLETVAPRKPLSDFTPS